MQTKKMVVGLALGVLLASFASPLLAECSRVSMGYETDSFDDYREWVSTNAPGYCSGSRSGHCTDHGQNYRWCSFGAHLGLFDLELTWDGTEGSGHPTAAECSQMCNDWPAHEHDTGDTGGGNPPNDGGDDSNGGSGNPPSPLVIKMEPGPWDFVGLENAVRFDLDNDGQRERVGWTNHGSHPFLAVDLDGDGLISNGAELFGNYSPQEPSAFPNGFLALRLYDENGDGLINSADTLIWENLLLWQDFSHDGVSDPGELTPISVSNVEQIDLDYSVSFSRVDSHGNFLWLQSQVVFQNRPSDNAIVDVFFVSQN